MAMGRIEHTLLDEGRASFPNRPKTIARNSTIPHKVTNVSIHDRGPGYPRLGAELRRIHLLRTPVNKAACVFVYTGVGTFSELGKERMRLLGQSPSPAKGPLKRVSFENRLRESMGIVFPSRNSASLHSDEYVLDPEGFG